MLKFNFSTKETTKNTAIIIAVSDKGKIGNISQKLDKKISASISKTINMASNFSGKKKQSLLIPAPFDIGADFIILFGVGDKIANMSPYDIEILGGSLFKKLKANKIKQAEFIIDDIIDADKQAEFAAHIAYGALLASYDFDKYKTKNSKKVKIEYLNFVLADAKEAKKHFDMLQKIASGVFFARDLVTEPANIIYPESFAKIVKKELTPLGIKVQILTEKQMEKLGMGALLAVGKGSARPPRMAIMHYNALSKSAKNKEPIAFVGKGVTFDTGGISLKPSAGMDKMKWDMGGAAAVVGAMKALASRKAKVNVVAIVGLAENMPSSKATRPGDVVKSMSGKTIEILNTDAEGRLVLADALCYVQEKFKPKVIVDLATLTGAIIVALGHEYAGVFTNDNKIAEQLYTAGEEVGEKIWHMPLCKSWDKAIDSPIADIQNITNSTVGAGSATAAAFLQRFVDDGVKWAHIDIAGMAWADREIPTVPKGGSGYGVRLLDNFVRKYFEK